LLVDLLLELGGRHGTWAIESKLGLAPKVTKGFHVALEDIQPQKAFLIYSGTERFPKSHEIEAISLHELVSELQTLA
jgi:hypothetical protein